MTTQTSTRATISPVMNDILEWSRTRPLWQRDALRRLVVNGVVSDDDIATLTLGCLSDANALDQGETVLLVVGKRLPRLRILFHLRMN
jgi:hypothetical protein